MWPYYFPISMRISIWTLLSLTRPDRALWSKLIAHIRMTVLPAPRAEKTSAAVNAWPIMLHRKMLLHRFMTRCSIETWYDPSRPRSARTDLRFLARMGAGAFGGDSDRGDPRADHISRPEIRRASAARWRYGCVSAYPCRHGL